MIQATLKDKLLVVDILTQAYDTNDTINETVNEPIGKRTNNTPEQEAKRKNKISKLMSYQFDICLEFGAVFLSESRKAAALILFPDKKKTTLRSIMNELKLISVIGLFNIPKVLRREIAYNKLLPKTGIIKGVLVGTFPDAKNKGQIKGLIEGLIDLSEVTKRPIYIESRIKENELWYARLGFETYYILKIGDRIWPCMKRENMKRTIESI